MAGDICRPSRDRPETARRPITGPTISTVPVGRSPYPGGPVADPTDSVTDLPDLTQLPLTELRSLDHPVLTNILRRAAEEAKNSVDAIAGFQAAI
jgi:FXSXX-COOH protein